MATEQSALFFLVDYENVHISPEDIQELATKPNHHIQIFVGVHQNKLDIDLVMAMQAFGERGKFVRTHATGKNALDFLLVYTAGQISQAQPKAAFCIVSADRDYDPLIEDLRNKGTEIKRISPAGNYSPSTLPPLIRMVSEMLRNAAPARPKSISALCNWLHAKLPDRSDQELESVILTMEKSNIIQVSEDKVTYRI